ncbi:MAG TPA: hypothetical protein PKX31_00060 [Chitinophagaceae bacterium]|nr:hypothetical protein [Chitinophagaceae bacterium]
MNTTTPKKELTLKIDAYAFDKFVFMRDHKDSEITMFGITHKENPLHVYDFRIVKQKVNSTSSDCCPEYMAEYIETNAMAGIPPINCERVWCHTHPMTGDSSANPSGKDMSTWNDQDNAMKNFMVMMILSKTGQITCKLRVRGNLSTSVNGLDHPYEVEKEIPVEIIKDEGYDAKILTGLKNIFGERAVDKLGMEKAKKSLLPHVSLIEIFPEFNELITEYDKLVSPDTYTVIRSGYQGYGGNHSHYQPAKNSFKKSASPEIIPEMLLELGEHRESFRVMTDNELQRMKAAFADIEDITSLQSMERIFEFDNPYNPMDGISVILGAIHGDLLEKDFQIAYKSNNKLDRVKAINTAGLKYPQFKDTASKINTGDFK